MKYLWICLILLSLTNVSHSRETIKVVTEEWPPYVIDNGKSEPSGHDYEVIKAVFERIDVSVNLMFVPWKRAISMIEDKSAGALLDVSYTKAREDFLIFPKQFISESNTVLFSLKSNEYNYNSIEDLSGKRIGTTSGYVYNDEFDNSPLFKRHGLKSHESNFKKIITGRIDFFAVNKSVGSYVAKNMGILNEVKYSEKSISGGELFLGFSKAVGHVELAKRFSEELKVFKNTEEYTDILKKYGL